MFGKSLVMFSGGLDSAAALQWCLENTDEGIHAHHVRLVNESRRHGAEMQAHAAILRYFVQSYPDKEIEYSTTTIDFSHVGSHFADVHIVSLVAANMTMRASALYRFTDNGHITGDRRMPGYFTRVVRGNRLIDQVANERNLDRALIQARRSYESMWAWEGRPVGVPQIFPLRDLNRGQVWEYLHPELRKLIWSCRVPRVEGNKKLPCGNCHTCLAFAKFGIDQYSQKFDPEVLEWLQGQRKNNNWKLKA